MHAYEENDPNNLDAEGSPVMGGPCINESILIHSYSEAYLEHLFRFDSQRHAHLLTHLTGSKGYSWRGMVQLTSD